jgi:hypothetical protein
MRFVNYNCIFSFSLKYVFYFFNFVAISDMKIVTIRWVYRGGRHHRGKLARLESSENGEFLSADKIFSVLRDSGVDLNRFSVWWFNCHLNGFERLEGLVYLSNTAFDTNAEDVVDIELDPLLALDGIASKITSTDPTGYFGIGVVRGRRAESLSVLWRSAYQLGASFVFTIGARHAPIMESEDCQIAFRSIPLWRFEDWDDFMSSAPFAAPIVALEMGGAPLETFAHPRCCVYLLGSEEDGLPKSILQSCPHVVEIPTIRARSFSIAAAGSIVLYDRLAKLRTLNISSA